LGFDAYFQVVIGGDSLSEKKPSPKPLLVAAEKFGVNPGDCWMIGDSRSDVEAARNAGCTPVAVSYGYNHGRPISDESPDWLFDSLKELQQQLVNLYPQIS
jgi:phosphoglycolate phosphatase